MCCAPQLGNWSVAHEDQWGYSRITADHDSLLFEFVQNTDGQVWDSVSLVPWF